MKIKMSYTRNLFQNFELIDINLTNITYCIELYHHNIKSENSK